MTIPSTVNRWDYIGTGAVAVYAYNALIFAASDLVLTMQDTLGNLTTLILDTDYTVSGVGLSAGGNVTLLTSVNVSSGFLPLNYLLDIRRVRPLTQTTDIRNQGEYFPEVIESAFDNCCMVDQQLEEQISRCLQLPETEVPSAFNSILPAAIVASALIQINPAANGYVFGPTPASIIAAAVAAALAAVGGNPTGQTNFLMANNQVAPANVTGLLFDHTVVRSAIVEYDIRIASSTPGEVRAVGEFTVIWNAVTTAWTLYPPLEDGDGTGVVFSITAGGQVQYTSPNTASFTIGKLAFRARSFDV